MSGSSFDQTQKTHSVLRLPSSDQSQNSLTRIHIRIKPHRRNPSSRRDKIKTGGYRNETPDMHHRNAHHPRPLPHRRRARKEDRPERSSRHRTESSTGPIAGSNYLKSYSTEKEHGKTVYEAEMIVNGHTEGHSVRRRRHRQRDRRVARLPTPLPAPSPDRAHQKGRRSEDHQGSNPLPNKGKLVAYEAAATLKGTKKGRDPGRPRQGPTSLTKSSWKYSLSSQKT